MKLIDFTHTTELIDLKKRIGAKDHEWTADGHWQQLDKFELLSKLDKMGEVDIPFEKITINKVDRTLELHGRKILVYIRDQYSDKEYKFHVAHCATLSDAVKNKRYSRYVASVKSEGVFLVNKIYDSYVKKDLKIQLNVCRNCLTSLNYNGYANSHQVTRNSIYGAFKLDEFFTKYKDTKVVQPKYSDLTAPLNNYTSDFRKIADQVKANRGYKCIDCKRDLSKQEHRKFLHMHHINSRKDDNRPENLEPVCIGCHSDKPGHNLKAHPDYWEYKSIFDPDLFGNFTP